MGKKYLDEAYRKRRKRDTYAENVSKEPTAVSGSNHRKRSKEKN
jgi:hypothetical protein